MGCQVDNISDGTLLKTLWGNRGKINSISFSADGKTLVSGSEETGVMVWDLDLDHLTLIGCSQIRDYLENNGNVNQGDRHICHEFH